MSMVMLAFMVTVTIMSIVMLAFMVRVRVTIAASVTVSDLGGGELYPRPSSAIQLLG